MDVNEAEVRATLVAVLAARVQQREKEPQVRDIGVMIARLAMAYMDGLRTIIQPFVTAFQGMGSVVEHSQRVRIAMRVVMPGYVERQQLLRTPALPAPEVIQSAKGEQGE